MSATGSITIEEQQSVERAMSRSDQSQSLSRNPYPYDLKRDSTSTLGAGQTNEQDPAHKDGNAIELEYKHKAHSSSLDDGALELADLSIVTFEFDRLYTKRTKRSISKRITNRIRIGIGIGIRTGIGITIIASRSS
jgi:hypothetical protein